MADDPITTLTRRVGEHVARLRERAGLSQAALAKKAGIASTTLNRLERGATMPDVASLSWIAAAVDVSIAELFSDESTDERHMATRQIARVLARRTKEDAATVLQIVNLIFDIKQRGRRSAERKHNLLEDK